MSENLDELGVNGEFEEDGREIVLDTSGEVELTDDATEGVAELRDTIAQQNSEAEQYAIEFLKKVVRIRGVRHTRTMHAINFDAMVVQLLESKAARMVSPPRCWNV